MRRLSRLSLVLAAAAATIATGLVGTAGAASNTTAVPAGTVDLGSGCTVTMVRSASGIINETDRAGCGTLPGVTADIWAQFRPTIGKVPNPSCAADAVYTIQGWQSYGLAPAYLDPAQSYNVCFYLVNPVVASGLIDSAAVGGVTVALPIAAGGHYRIDVSGTWQNGSTSTEDAEFTTLDGWTTYEDGYAHDPYFLGEGFGDLMVNDAFVNWGAFASSHMYSLTQVLGSSVDLNVFDGDSTGGNTVPNAGWYADNSGSLTYTITFLGL